MQDLEKKWKTKFGLMSENVVRRLDDDNNYSYKQKVKNLNSYKADWNGDCTEVEEIYYLKPFESTCRKGDLSKEKLEEDLKKVCSTLKNTIEYNYDETNHYTYISWVTYEIEYSNSTIKSCVLKILYTNNASTKTKFKVQWLNVGDSENILAEGYRQGKPIKIGLKDNTYYKNGFFLGISKNDGTCATQYNDISNFKQFLFKVDDINSCTKQDEKFKDTLIYKAFCTEDVLNFKVGKFFNSNLLDLNDENKWIKINVTGCEEVLKEEDNNANIGIDINLLFLISKKGDQYSPVEYIEYAKMKLAKGSNNNKIVSFKTTFFEFSYSSITNSKEGKITSLKQFPKDLLESLNPNKK